MLYIRFVWWLTQKANYWETKKLYGDAGVYNHFHSVRMHGLRPLSSLIPLVLYGAPFAGYLYLVTNVLPFSDNVRMAILMGSLVGGWVVAAILLIRKAKR